MAPRSTPAQRLERIAKKDERMKLFVDALFGMNFNGTQAAMTVGVAPASAHVMASKWLRNPKVQELMTLKRAEIEKRHNVSFDKVITRLQPIMNANMADYIRVRNDGDVEFDFVNVSREKFSAVSEITIDTYTEGRGEEAREVKRTKFKLHNPMVASDQINKMLGYYKDDGKEPGAGVTNNYITHNTQNNVTIEHKADSYKDALESINGD